MVEKVVEKVENLKKKKKVKLLDSLRDLKTTYYYLSISLQKVQVETSLFYEQSTVNQLPPAAEARWPAR